MIQSEDMTIGAEFDQGAQRAGDGSTENHFRASSSLRETRAGRYAELLTIPEHQRSQH